METPPRILEKLLRQGPRLLAKKGKQRWMLKEVLFPLEVFQNG